MTLVDLITFIISFSLFIFLMFRQAMKERNRKLHPEIVEQEQAEEDEALREFLRAHNISEEEEDELEEEIRPLKKSEPIKIEVKKTILPKRNLSIPSESVLLGYDTYNDYTVSKGERVLRQLPELKNIVIYHEIFGPPKAFRDD